MSSAQNICAYVSNWENTGGRNGNLSNGLHSFGMSPESYFIKFIFWDIWFIKMNIKLHSSWDNMIDRYP